jgi:hypothetical protein
MKEKYSVENTPCFQCDRFESDFVSQSKTIISLGADLYIYMSASEK